MGYNNIDLMSEPEKKSMVLYCQSKIVEIDSDLKRRKTYDRVKKIDNFMERYILSKAGVITFTFFSVATLHLTNSVLASSVLPGTLFVTSSALTHYRNKNDDLWEQYILHNQKRAYLYVIHYLENGTSAISKRLNYPHIPIDLNSIKEPFRYGDNSFEENFSKIVGHIAHIEALMCQFDGIDIEKDITVNSDLYIPDESEKQYTFTARIDKKTD